MMFVFTNVSPTKETEVKASERGAENTRCNSNRPLWELSGRTASTMVRSLVAPNSVIWRCACSKYVRRATPDGIAARGAGISGTIGRDPEMLSSAKNSATPELRSAESKLCADEGVISARDSKIPGVMYESLFIQIEEPKPCEK